MVSLFIFLRLPLICPWINVLTGENLVLVYYLLIALIILKKRKIKKERLMEGLAVIGFSFVRLEKRVKTLKEKGLLEEDKGE